MASNVQGKKDIALWVLDHVPDGGTVLDVGACDGVWAKFLLSLDPDIIIDGVEAYELNVIMHSLHRFYRNVYAMDIDDYRYAHYDIIIFGDVIEHMTVEKAQRVLTYAWDRCDDMIVAVPYMYPQDAIYGNPWEVHKQPDLTPEIFDERYPGFEPLWQTDFYCYYHKAGGASK